MKANAPLPPDFLSCPGPGRQVPSRGSYRHQSCQDTEVATGGLSCPPPPPTPHTRPPPHSPSPLPKTILVRILTCFSGMMDCEALACQEERRVSVSFGKRVPVKAEKKLALVQPWMEGEDDLQTLEEIPVILKTQSGLCSLSHSGSLSSQRGGSGVYLWWFSFSLEEGNGWGVTSVGCPCPPPPTPRGLGGRNWLVFLSGLI